MRTAVAGLLAAMLLLVAVPATVLAGTGGERPGSGAAGPAPQGHGDGWLL
ncbi:MAG TPA: hypothetical protein VGK88_04530 [bacterium]